MKDSKTFLDTVCEQIRFQKAHDFVKKELQDHITDQAAAFMEQGIEKETALQKAVAEMGDPVLVGTELDRIHRPKLEWRILIFIGLLLFAHFLIQYIFFKEVFYTAPLWKNGIFLLFSVGVMLFFYYLDFTILAKHIKLIYIGYVIVLFLCYRFTWTSGYFLSMDLNETFSGVMGGFTDIYFIISGTFDSDFPIKLPVFLYFFPVIFVGLLYHCRGKSYKSLLLCSCSFFPLLFFFFGFLLFKAPVIIIGIVSIMATFISIHKNWFSVKKFYAVCLVCIITLFYIFLLYYLDKVGYDSTIRFYDYMNYIQTILKSNLKASCLLEKGKDIFIPQYYGNSIINAFDFLKEWAEYFPAYLLHYGGWLVLLPILAIYFFFMGKCFFFIKKQKSQLGFLTATVILLLFFGISIWNIAANTGFFIIINPLGIPFFSTSDSINIVFFALIGILLSVFRTGSITTDACIKIEKKKRKPWISLSENSIHIFIPLPFKRKKRS